MQSVLAIRQFRASRVLLALGGLEVAVTCSMWLARLGGSPESTSVSLLLSALCAALGVGVAAWAWLRFRMDHAHALASRQGVSLESHLSTSVRMGVFVNAILVMQILSKLH